MNPTLYLGLEPGADIIAGLHLALLFLLSLCAVLSAVALLPLVASLAWLRDIFSKPHPEPGDENGNPSPSPTSMNVGSPSYLESFRSSWYSQNSIFRWNASRLFSCIALVPLTLAIAVLGYNPSRKVGTQHSYYDIDMDITNNGWNFHSFLSREWAELVPCLFFIYATVLSVMTLAPTSSIQTATDRHLSVLLPIAFIVCMWRDWFLLATYQVTPIDSVNGWLTWTRVGVISFAAFLVPLCIPRPYIYQESQELNTPNPEETASIISLLLYDFMSPLIWTAYRSTKLNYDQLPPLAYYDQAAFLKQRSFSKLDPLSHSGRHLFWGIVDVFWKEYCVMSGMIFIKVSAELAGPMGIRYILKYLEDPSQPGYFRPWVWILWLFLGPVVGAIAMQWYVFITTGMVVRIEAMVAQLLFDHTLRIRVVGKDSSDESLGSARATVSEIRDLRPNSDKLNHSNSHLMGKIHNLISTDLSNVSRDFLSWAGGLFAMIVLIFVPGKLVHLINKAQTDSRVQLIVESLTIIRTIKLFAWEKRIKTQSKQKRKMELDWYRKRQFLGLITMNINYALPLIVMMVTFASHTLVLKKSLDASSVFSSIAVFDTLRTQLRLLFLQFPSSIQSKVSLDRTSNFLTKTELLDSRGTTAETAAPSDSAIGFHNTSFAWSNTHTRPSTSRRNFLLRIDGKLLFQHGCINMVVGPTGCGKTSLLMALLGEMHYIPSGPDSWVSLPRGEGIAFAAQEAWIQNATIRENILFGEDYDDGRYKKVVFQCGLEMDLGLLELGDQTEVGERGVTLSGGQRARVSLARAIYSKADVIILDDVLSALDVHTSRWIIDKCFRGELVTGRTLIIATHNIAVVSQVANFMVALGPGGRILSQENISGSNPKFEDETEKDPSDHSEPDGKSDGTTTGRPSSKTNLITAEELAEGQVGWPALKLFIFAVGGIGFWFVYLAGFVLANVAALLQTYWLGIWARAYSTDPSHPTQVKVTFYLGVYSSICICGMVLYSSAFMAHVFGSIRAARRIHDQLVSSIFAAPLYWLDSTPIGRIISRFTQDIRSVDCSLPIELQNVTDMTIQLFPRFIAIILVSPAFSLAGALLLMLGAWIGRVYISAQISVKRHMSNARSPMFSYFHAALDGIPTIRAYGAQDMMRSEVQKRIDTHTRAARTFWNLNRWIAIRMDALGGVFSAGLAAWLVYVRKGVDASDAGFSLNMAVALSGGILWWIRAINEFQVQTNSLERIHSYLTIPHEPSSHEVPPPPAYWPSSGSLEVHNLDAQYSPDGPRVLHDLSFQVKHGERVGIVGRTGSGKSSLVLALLRMISTSGEVYYDGIETGSIPLESLRSNVTVVPQQPELSSGTVRENLDPFGECEDAALWDALQAVGLAQNTGTSSQDRVDSTIGLDTPIAPGGSNLSLGQRQMVALARAIVRRTKLVILDEATAAIDHETDSKIHHALGSIDQTVLIVAHRLRTICHADKVMVLDAGRLVEYDSPRVLLQKGGAFKSLVDASGKRDELYALIEGAN